MSKDRIAIRTLIIDDDRALCRRLYGWLDEAGYDPVTFHRGDDGVRHAEGAACQVALVDLTLPDEDAAGVIARLRDAAGAPQVVAMSAFPEVAEVIAAVRAGASDLLEKPIGRETLLATLDRLLRRMGVTGRSEPEFNQRLGARLRTVRGESGRTLEEVAAAAGLSAPQLSQIENGRTGTSMWTLARVCAALRVPIARVFDGI